MQTVSPRRDFLFTRREVDAINRRYGDYLMKPHIERNSDHHVNCNSVIYL